MTISFKPFFAALRELAQKRLVPTALDTEQLREIDASIRRQALFSARMTQLHALQTLQDGLKGMLDGKDNLATAKLKMTEMYRALGYDAEAGGFPQDKTGTVPPARKGTLRDLASDKRMTLTITTNYRIAANQAFAAKGMEERRLHQWPAWELVRIGRVRTPRGFKRTKGGAMEPVPGDDWQARFVAAGGELFDKGTRMIAPKGSDVWQRLGDGAGGYKDTLGNPFAPFAFGSKYGVREVARDECLLLGVISAEENAPDAKAGKAPAAVPAVQSKASAAGIDPTLIEAMKRDLAKQEDGSVRLKRELDRELAAADKAYRARNATRNRLSLVVAMLMNHGTSAGAYKAWMTRRRKGWTPLQVQEARRGMAGMKKAVATKQDVMSAMHIPGLGPVDFRWSVGPRGMRRIYEDHKISRRIPLILMRGKLTKGKTRAFVDYKGHRVVLASNLFGQPSNHWVLTGYRDKGKEKGGQPMNSVKIPIRQSLQSSPLHFLRGERGAVAHCKNTSLRTRCKALVAALERRAA